MEYSVINQLREGLGAPPVTNIEPWEPFHSATWLQVMALGLSGNMDAEVLRYRLIQQAGEEALDVLAPGYDYAAQPLILEPGWSPVPAQSRQVSPLDSLPGLENVAMLRRRAWGRTTGWCRVAARPAASRCSPTIRI